MESKTCPYVSWYKFKTCGIQTCKNYTNVTDSKCIELDRVRPVGIKIISDAELLYYKFPATTATRTVSIHRKQAINSVKYILTLKRFLDYIQATFATQGQFSPSINSGYVKNVEKRYPLNVPELEFKQWMWFYLTDEDTFVDFCKTLQGEAKHYEIHNLLNLTTLQYSKLIHRLRK